MKTAFLLTLTTLSCFGSTIVLDNFNGSTTGTAYGNPGYTSGPPGLDQAVQLNAGNFIQYAIPTTLESQGTIELWVNPTAFSTGILNFNWNNTTTTPSAGYVLHLGLDASGDVAASGWASNPANMYAINSANAVSLNQWTFIALSWSASGARIYVNGQLSASGNQPWLPSAPDFAYLNYWGSNALGGVDRLQISDVQLSDAQILADAQLTPEPLTWSMLSIGLLAIALSRQHSRK